VSRRDRPPELTRDAYVTSTLAVMPQWADDVEAGHLVAVRCRCGWPGCVGWRMAGRETAERIGDGAADGNEGVM
jgi:hypothetical protein